MSEWRMAELEMIKAGHGSIVVVDARTRKCRLRSSTADVEHVVLFTTLERQREVQVDIALRSSSANRIALYGIQHLPGGMFHGEHFGEDNHSFSTFPLGAFLPDQPTISFDLRLLDVGDVVAEVARLLSEFVEPKIGSVASNFELAIALASS